MSGGSPWAAVELPDLLAAHALAGVAERPFEHDGWSGATLTVLDGAAGRYILKRTSWATDWIARSTRDHALREAVLAADPVPLPHSIAPAHLGAAADGTAAAILMPDLSAWLIPWDRGDGGPVVVDGERLARVVEAMATVHSQPWAALRAVDGPDRPAWPWCPVRERVELLSRASAMRYHLGGLWVGARFLAGWDAFDALATVPARALVDDLTADPGPLVATLGQLPSTGLHGDLKLANVALLPDGRASLIDWQLTTFAPVALELGWFLVSNVSQLAAAPDAILDDYRSALATAGGDALIGDWEAQRDLAILAGLLLRGWRKGLDADAGVTLPDGTTARDDLRWWCDAAAAAAARRL